MNNSPPKRLAQKQPGKLPIVLIIVTAAFVALAVGSYFGLCSWVKNNGMLMPGTLVAGLPDGGTVDVGKLDARAAVELVESRLNTNLSQRSLTITFGDGKTALLDGNLLYADPALPITAAMEEKAAIPLYQLGLKWFGYYNTSGEHTVSALAITEEGESLIEQISAQIAGTVYVAPVDFSYEVTEETVELTLGSDGQQVDLEQVRQSITEALLNGDDRLVITGEVIPSAALTGEILSQLVHVPAQVSVLQEDGTLSPTILGHGIDPEEAQALIDTLQSGQSCSIPLYDLEPDLSQAEGLLFQDLLCSSDTYMSGPDGRRNNIRLAAAAIHGTIVLPGETFSYNAIVGERTAEKGYKEATVYVQGEDRQELGGGICQLASAIYYCCLYSDLEIVERKPHRFAVTYVPYGLDATIAWGSIDYKFTNNTDYPILIQSTTEGTHLYVSLHGTKINDNYVKMERVQLSSTPYETVYELDPLLSAGQTEEIVHAYTGYEYDTYRCVYDGAGNLLSKTYEAYSKYRSRDKVIAVSPADALQYGLDPVTGEPVPSEPVPSEPVPSEPVPSEPVPSEPVPAEPTVPADPVVTDPTIPVDPVPEVSAGSAA